MAVLATRTSPGGAVGDTFMNQIIARVFADGVYGWVDRSVADDLFDPSADLASRPAIGTGDDEVGDGFTTRVATNGLLYQVREGVYVVVDFQIDVATVAARDALTEQETGQRVRIDSEGGRVDTWNGTAWVEGVPETGLFATYAEMPNPTTVRVGTTYRVTNDPVDALNGVHVATGANPGSNAAYFEPA